MENKDKLPLLILLAIVLAAAIAIFIAAYNIGGIRREKEQPEEEHKYTTTILEPESTEVTPVEEGYYTIQMELTAKSKNGKVFSCKIANARENVSPVYVTLELDGEELFKSGILQLGDMNDNFTVNRQLEDGQYDAVLVFHQVYSESQQEFSSVSVAYTLEVNQ